MRCRGDRPRGSPECTVKRTPPMRLFPAPDARRPFGRFVRPIAMAATLAVSILSITAHQVAAADAPNSCSQSMPFSARNVWLSGRISRAADVDWYHFDNASHGYKLLTLGNLPKNYRLELFNRYCFKLAGSNVSGVQFEEIFRKMPAGPYFLKVSGTSDSSFSSTAYRLKFRDLPWKLQVLSRAPAWTDGLGNLHIAGEVLNNRYTPENRKLVQVTATLYDNAGNVLTTDVASTAHSIVEPRTRSPFEIVTELPDGYDHYKLTVSSSFSDVDLMGIGLEAGEPFTDGLGVRHWVGTLTNGNDFTVDVVKVILTQYDSLGLFLNMAVTESGPIGSGGTAPFDVSTDRFEGTNRVRLSIDAGPEPTTP